MAKKKTVSMRLFVIVTAVLCAFSLTAVIFAARAGENNSTGSAKMEALCSQSAKYASKSFENYLRFYEDAEKQPDRYYRSAVADLNVFLCMYYTLYGEDEARLADYVVMMELYDRLLQYPEESFAHLHDLSHTLSALAEDPADSDAMEHIKTIRDALYAATTELTETEAEETE